MKRWYNVTAIQLLLYHITLNTMIYMNAFIFIIYITYAKFQTSNLYRTIIVAPIRTKKRI